MRRVESEAPNHGPRLEKGIDKTGKEYKYLIMDDGRKIVVDIRGAPLESSREPIFYWHGSPDYGSGRDIPRSIKLAGAMVSVISITRPGYYESDKYNGSSVADMAKYAGEVADKFGIDKFRVMGKSGGGAYALGTGALFPQRVKGIGVLAGPAPMDFGAMDEWIKGMDSTNVAAFTSTQEQTIQTIRDNYARFVSAYDALVSSKDMRTRDFFKHFPPGLNSNEQEDIARSRIELEIIEAYRYSMLNGPDGWIDDSLAKAKPWDVDLSQITAPVLLHYEENDNKVPPNHKEILKRALVNADIRESVGNATHFNIADKLLNFFVQVQLLDNNLSKG